MTNTLSVYTASFCQPCKQLKATLDNLDIEYQVKDADNDPDDFTSMSVRNVPTIIVTDEDGKEVFRASGNKSSGYLLDMCMEYSIAVGCVQ